VKNCPYCAEAIQDAAIVCKHCGRDLKGANVGAVTVRPQSSGWLRVFALVAVVSLIAITGMVVLGFVAFQLRPSLQNRRVSGECQLSGEAIAIPHEARVGGDTLEITNRDRAWWDNAELRIFGTTTIGAHKEPAGVYTLHRDLAPGVTRGIALSDFQAADGSRWVPLTMHAEGMGITATLRGEHCEVELSVHTP
jgi:hypothetical protein